MDQWLTDEIKELIFTPCLSTSGMIGRRLDNRIRMGQEIDERALTESLADSLDTSSSENLWGNVIGLLRDQQIYLSTHVAKTTRENITGADIGFTIDRHNHSSKTISSTTYAVMLYWFNARKWICCKYIVISQANEFSDHSILHPLRLIIFFTY